ncbi:unnamed protein product [Amoebophrya sp. A120]|nr:unnamed protein product [Amoebophrya sp. A120]|eukprot:GSA120T00017742001.1
MAASPALAEDAGGPTSTMPNAPKSSTPTFLELRFGEAEDRPERVIKLPRKPLCESLPMLAKVLSSPLDDSRGGEINVVDMGKLGISFDEFLIVLHRVSDTPILTPQEEYKLRRKHNIATLDEVELNSGAHYLPKIPASSLERKPGCAGSETGTADDAAAGSCGAARPAFEEQLASSPATSTQAFQSQSQNVSPRSPWEVVTLHTDSEHGSPADDRPAALASKNSTLANYYTDGTASEGAGTTETTDDSSTEECCASGFTRSIYDLLSLFMVPGCVETEFVDLFFRQDMTAVLRWEDEQESNNVLHHRGRHSAPRPDEPHLIDLHNTKGFLQIRNRTDDLKWPRDVMRLEPVENRLDREFKLTCLAESQHKLARTMGDSGLFGIFLGIIDNMAFSVHRDMRWVLCGGAVTNALTQKDPDDFSGDVDLFLVMPHIQDLPPEKREAEARTWCEIAIERLADELSKLRHGPPHLEVRGQPERRLPSIGDNILRVKCIQRSAHALTFYTEKIPSCFGGSKFPPIQVIGWYSSLTNVLESFDIAACQVAYDRGRFYASRKGATALATRTNLVTVNDLSPQYIYRLGKYLARGFGIAVPLDRQVTVEKVPMATRCARYQKHAHARGEKCARRDEMGRLLQVFEDHMEQKRHNLASFLVEHANLLQPRKSSTLPRTLVYPIECSNKSREKEAVTAKLRELRHSMYQTYMQKTTIPERVILMALQRQKSDSLEAKGSAAVLNVDAGGHPAVPPCDTAICRNRYPVHALEVADTFAVSPSSESNKNSIPLVCNHRQAKAARCAVEIGSRGAWRVNSDWYGPEHQNSSMVSILERIEFRKVAASVEEGTSCGVRLLGDNVDSSFAIHCKSLYAQDKEQTTFITDNLKYALRPESGHALTVGMPEGVACRFPLNERAFPETAKFFREKHGEACMLVPKELRGYFEMTQRDGKGSFQKKHPDEVIQSGQWWSKNIHGELDFAMRLLLGLPDEVV